MPVHKILFPALLLTLVIAGGVQAAPNRLVRLGGSRGVGTGTRNIVS